MKCLSPEEGTGELARLGRGIVGAGNRKLLLMEQTALACVLGASGWERVRADTGPRAMFTLPRGQLSLRAPLKEAHQAFMEIQVSPGLPRAPWTPVEQIRGENC